MRAQSITSEPIVLIQKRAAVARELPSSRKGTGPYLSESRPASGARNVRVAENAAMNMPIFVAE